MATHIFYMASTTDDIRNHDEIKSRNFFRRVVDLYVDGFRNMTVGRTLWVLILLKVVLLLFVFKLIFFPNILQRDYSTDRERAQAVRRNLTERSAR